MTTRSRQWRTCVRWRRGRLRRQGHAERISQRSGGFGFGPLSTGEARPRLTRATSLALILRVVVADDKGLSLLLPIRVPRDLRRARKREGDR